MDGNDASYSLHCHGFIMVEQRQIGEEPLNGRLNDHDDIRGQKIIEEVLEVKNRRPFIQEGHSSAVQYSLVDPLSCIFRTMWTLRG